MRKERLTIRVKKGVGVVVTGYISDKHLTEAISKLKACEIERKERPQSRKPFKKIRKFFCCLIKALQPSIREQHVVCRLPLEIELEKRPAGSAAPDGQM